MTLKLMSKQKGSEDGELLDKDIAVSKLHYSPLNLSMLRCPSSRYYLYELPVSSRTSRAHHVVEVQYKPKQLTSVKKACLAIITGSELVVLHVPSLDAVEESTTKPVEVVTYLPLNWVLQLSHSEAQLEVQFVKNTGGAASPALFGLGLENSTQDSVAYLASSHKLEASGTHQAKVEVESFVLTFASEDVCRSTMNAIRHFRHQVKNAVNWVRAGLPASFVFEISHITRLSPGAPSPSGQLVSGPVPWDSVVPLPAPWCSALSRGASGGLPSNKPGPSCELRVYVSTPLGLAVARLNCCLLVQLMTQQNSGHLQVLAAPVRAEAEAVGDESEDEGGAGSGGRSTPTGLAQASFAQDIYAVLVVHLEASGSDGERLQQDNSWVQSSGSSRGELLRSISSECSSSTTPGTSPREDVQELSPPSQSAILRPSLSLTRQPVNTPPVEELNHEGKTGPWHKLLKSGRSFKRMMSSGRKRGSRHRRPSSPGDLNPAQVSQDGNDGQDQMSSMTLEIHRLSREMVKNVAEGTTMVHNPLGPSPEPPGATGDPGSMTPPLDMQPRSKAPSLSPPLRGGLPSRGPRDGALSPDKSTRWLPVNALLPPALVGLLPAESFRSVLWVTTCLLLFTSWILPSVRLVVALLLAGCLLAVLGQPDFSGAPEVPSVYSKEDRGELEDAPCIVGWGPGPVKVAPACQSQYGLRLVRASFVQGMYSTLQDQLQLLDHSSCDWAGPTSSTSSGTPPGASLLPVLISTPEPPWMTEDVKRRFIKAHRGKMAKVEGMARKVHQWRLDRDIDQILYRYPVNFELFQSCLISPLLKVTPEGDVVTVIKIGTFFRLYKEMVARGLGKEALEEYIAFNQEYLWQRVVQAPLPHGQTIAIADLEGFNLFHLNRGTIDMFKTVVATIDSFPERLSRALLVHTPSWFDIAWKIVAELLPPDTRAKVEVLGNDKGNIYRCLSRYLGPDMVPREYGGSCDMPYHDYPPQADLVQYVRDLDKKKTGHISNQSM